MDIISDIRLSTPAITIPGGGEEEYDEADINVNDDEDDCLPRVRVTRSDRRDRTQCSVFPSSISPDYDDMSVVT